MADLPTGIATFLFTGIEGSTTLWKQHPPEMRTELNSAARRSWHDQMSTMDGPLHPTLKEDDLWR
jgi:class 3 adenylate cyclase